MFKKEVKLVKALAVDKARDMMLQMYEEMKTMFKKEYSTVVKQFNDLVFETSKLDKVVNRYKK